MNVQPNGAAGTFTSPLDATPKHGTAIVADQTIVRAIELDILGGQGAVVALANAASGPSTGPTSTPTTPSTTVPSTSIPTAVPAALRFRTRGVRGH